MRRWAAFAALAAGLSVWSLAVVSMAGGSSQPPNPDGPVSWLSTGDSYSSGEGIDDTGTGTNYCAQSRLAYGPLAADLLRSQREWEISPEAFTACTGHVIADFYTRRDPDKGSLWEWTQEQLQQQPASPDQRFDVITFSFGGNDIGFASILRDCLPIWDDWGNLFTEVPLSDACDLSEIDIETRIDRLLEGDPSREGPGEPYHEFAGPFGPDGTLMSLSDFYRKVADDHLSERGTLLVLGYPRLITPSEDWAEWRGNTCEFMDSRDTDMLGRTAEYLDDKLAEAVQEADPSAQRIQYISRLDLWEDGGRSHELCGGNTEWLNGVSIGFWDGSFRKEHSFHPNDIGHAATAEALANELDNGRFAPTPTAPPVPAPQDPASADPTPAPTQASERPPVTSGNTWDPGDPFSASCVVAWPTAPLRSSSGTQMRMNCEGVPSQFLFVDVFVPDPDLSVNPSTGYFDVRGEIVEAADSEMGFGVLLVYADEVDL